MHKMHCLLCLSLLFATCKKEEGNTNRPPAITSLTGNLAGASAYDYRFAALATDQDFDNLTYSWDFGDGITKANGAKNEAHTYAANAPATVTVKLEVSDGKAVSTASLTLTLSHGNPVTIVGNPAVRFQTMEGFGGFGAQTVYWEPGPYTSASFINDIVTDLGAALQGGLGMAGSANVHASEPGRVALFEPVHGSAPPLVGKNLANPFAALLTTGMMLEHLGFAGYEARIERAVTAALNEGMCTKDVGGSRSTTDASAFVRERVLSRD